MSRLVRQQQSPAPPFPPIAGPTASLLATLPGQGSARAGAAGPHAAGSTIMASSNLGSLPGHLELTRQLDGAFEEELRKLEEAAEAFYDQLDGSMTGAHDPKRCEEALKTLQAQLMLLASLSRVGLGALPVPYPSAPPAPAVADGSAPVPAPPQTLEGLTERWGGKLQALFGRRQAYREGVSVAEGVFKRVA